MYWSDPGLKFSILVWRSIIFRVVVVVAWLAPLITSHLIEWNKRRGLRWINEWTIRIKIILIPKWEVMNLDYSLLRKNPQDPCFCGFSIVSNSWKKFSGRKNQAECFKSLTRALSKRTAEYCGRRKMTLFLRTSCLSSVRHILFYNVVKLEPLPEASSDHHKKFDSWPFKHSSNYIFQIIVISRDEKIRIHHLSPISEIDLGETGQILMSWFMSKSLDFVKNSRLQLENINRAHFTFLCSPQS